MCLCMVITYSKRPGKVANPACGQLNRENEYFLVPVHVAHRYMRASIVLNE